MDIAHIISSRLRFDLIEIYLMTKLIICVLIGLTVVATFIVHLNYFEEKYFVSWAINK